VSHEYCVCKNCKIEYCLTCGASCTTREFCSALCAIEYEIKSTNPSRFSEAATDAIVKQYRDLHAQRTEQNIQLALVAAELGYRLALNGHSLESVLYKVKESFKVDLAS
jgi:hypothetical protein